MSPPGDPTAGSSRTRQASSGAAAAASVEQELSNRLQQIRLQGRFKTELATKPIGDCVTTGQKVRLITNMYRIRVVENESVYHSDLTFKAVKTGRVAQAGDEKPVTQFEELKVNRVVKQAFEQMKESVEAIRTANVFFDGKQNLYSVGDMLVPDEDEGRFDCNIDGEQRIVLYKYFYTGQSVTLTNDPLAISQDAIQAMEIGLGYEAGKTMIQRGVKFFERTEEPKILGKNLLLRLGFVKSVRACDGGLLVNLDRAAAIFQEGGPLLNVFLNVLEFKDHQKHMFRMTPQFKLKLERELSNLKVAVVHPNLPYSRRVKIDRNSLALETVSDKKFEWIEKDSSGRETKRTVSIQQYYREKYGIQLDGNLTCLTVGQNHQTYIPVQLCQLIGDQYYDKKMLLSTQASVTKETIKLPNERYAQIQRSLKQLKTLTTDGAINAQIDPNPVRVDGMLQQPPVMQWGPEPGTNVARQTNVSLNASGYKNPCDYDAGRFVQANKLDRWSVLQIQFNARFEKTDAVKTVKDFANVLVLNAREHGWELHPQPRYKSFNYVPKSEKNGYAALRNLMLSAVEKGKLQMLVVIIPNDAVYNDVKQIGNQIGLLTQCIRLDVDDDYALKCGPKGHKITQRAYVKNVILKMNGKLGGINAKLAERPDFLKKKVMLIGMDVYHPGEGSVIKESLAGIVASYTPTFTNYFQAARAQPQNREKGFKRKEEISTAVFEVLMDFFERWKKVNGFYPENILIYRDGVSEGQFEKVRIIELDQVYKAMAQKGFRAKVTFVTVQKRHHFRMFVDKGNGVDNPLPGTVVDKDVVSASRFEFYLNSHFALKGTSKPSHYCVVHNECGLNFNQMVHISYYLCYLCSRCNKPISIPAPVKYAHLVSEMASKIVASSLENRLPGKTNDWIRVHEDFLNKLNYA